MKKLGISILISLLMVTLSACVKDEITFTLIGKEYVSYTVADEYTESGFIAKSGRTDLSDYVTISHDIDNSKADDYTVTYTLNYDDQIQEITRTVMYRDEGCEVTSEPTITLCKVNYSKYLHTYISLTFYYEGDQFHNQVEAIYNTVEAYLLEYNNLSDKYKSYEGYVNVKTINDAPTETHVLDERLFDMIQFALDHQDEVNNLFNIALGPVLQVWHDYRELADPFTNVGTSLPSMEVLQEKNQFTDSSKIVLNETEKSITMEENMSIDLGGMSKGFISNIITGYLDSLDLTGYLLNNGNSNISIGGTHPLREAGKFILAATDPTGEKYPGFATIYLGDGDQLVTSGDYQQYFVVDGEVYHHIINPNTLMPERYTRTVSIVINGDAGLADLYSTAIFTMTVEEGIAFVDSIDGLEAIWYGLDGTIYYSENFERDYLGELIP